MSTELLSQLLATPPTFGIIACGAYLAISACVGQASQFEDFCEWNQKACKFAFEEICKCLPQAKSSKRMDHKTLVKEKELWIPYNSNDITRSLNSARANRLERVSDALFTAALYESWASRPRRSRVFTDFVTLFTEIPNDNNISSYYPYCPLAFRRSNPSLIYLQPHVLRLPDGIEHQILVELSKSADPDDGRPFTLNIYFSSTWKFTNPSLEAFDCFKIFDDGEFFGDNMADVMPQLFRVDFGDDPLVGLWSLYTRRLSRKEILPNENHRPLSSWIWTYAMSKPQIYKLPPITDQFYKRRLLLNTVEKLYSLVTSTLHPTMKFSDVTIFTQSD